VADINESVTILSNRLSLYAASLPKQARWQAQLLVWEVLDDPQARLFLGNIDSIQRDVERIEDQFADIRDVLVDVDDILAGQRLAAFQQMNDEILALADALARQREAIMALVDSGRVAVFEDVSAQRVAAMTELDSIVQHAVDQALRGSDRVIDHLFIRTIQLMAGLIVLGIIGLAILRRRSRTV
jgi:tetrahydromethanopterin S-methyltransferase subunit F